MFVLFKINYDKKTIHDMIIYDIISHVGLKLRYPSSQHFYCLLFLLFNDKTIAKQILYHRFKYK